MQLRLVADRSVQHGLDRLELARHPLEAVEERSADATADADLIARIAHRTTLTGDRVIRLHPPGVMPDHPHAREGAPVSDSGTVSRAPATREGHGLGPGGEFSMGSEDFYPEERPVHRVAVEGFWIDERPVTVGQFRRFVKDTGYVTLAERPLDPELYPDADPELLVPGALVFRPTRGPVDLSDVRNWWSYTPGACWSRPEGPGSDTYTRGRHPVTQVAYEDAEAYAAWAGKALPTEAEWEYAARGGLDGKAFAWGDELAPERGDAGELLAGRVPVAERDARRLRRHLAGRQLSRPTATACST